MGERRRVYLDDIIGTDDVARMIGLAQSSSVRVYRLRYPDFPTPLGQLGSGRCLMWSRTEVARWMRKHGRSTE
jgi:predicted DNA-binding transcriptional regulator AlpA